MPDFNLRRPVRADRRPAGRDRAAQRRAGQGRPPPDAARRHRHGQDRDARLDDRQPQQADAGPRPQQDARRPALRRVPRVLPRERRRVLRQLLRLLPARGVPAPERHLHREGLVAQRRDRPAPPCRHPRPVRASRRHHRGLGVVHLRPRRAGRLRRDRAQAPDRRPVPARRRPAPPGRPPVPAQRPGAGPGPVPGPRRHARAPARLGGDARPDRVLRRPVERITELDPLTGELLAERKETNVYPATHYVTPQDKLKEAIVDIEAEMEERVGRPRGRRTSPRRRPAPPADDVRPRDDARARLLHRHRELLAPPVAARGRAAGRGRCSTTSRRTGCSSSTSRT